MHGFRENNFNLSDILARVKETSFQDDDSMSCRSSTTNGSRTTSGVRGAEAAVSSRRTLEVSNGRTRGDSSDTSDQQSSYSGPTYSMDGSHSTVLTVQSHYSQGARVCSRRRDKEMSRPPAFSTVNNHYVLDVDAVTQLSPPMVRANRSNSSGASSTEWNDGKSSSIDSSESDLFSNLITMAHSPDNAFKLLKSDAMDILTSTIYPESCSNCGHMPLDQIYHPSKRKRRSQSISAITSIYKNIGDSGRQHLRIHKHATALINSSECLMDTFTSIRSQQNEDNILPELSPLKTLAKLTQLSFDENYRAIMNNLNIIYAVSEFIVICATFQPIAFSFEDSSQIDLSECLKYGCTLLTNLTCGDHHNKAALCQLSPVLVILSSAISGQSEDVVRIVAGLFRNLSWKASLSSKEQLTECHVTQHLVRVRQCRDSTLKVITSTLWNLTAHNAHNKEVVCRDGLEMINMVLEQAVTRDTALLENSLGILRNISSQIAQVPMHRVALRELNLLPKLVLLLRSTNDTIVTTAVGALWNLSARSLGDQSYLKQLGAVPLLRSLTLHNDKAISKSAGGALRNILNGSTSPPSHYSPPPHTTPPPDSARTTSGSPEHYWLEDHSLELAEHGNTKAKVLGRGRENSKQKLRFASTVDQW